jgi:hypothetical protein
LIDALIDHYETTEGPDLDKLKKFFEFNDLLDRSRNTQLQHHVPELDKARELVS